MKFLSLLAATGLAATAIAAPVSAQHVTKTTTVTTVNKVHGPLKILPHHNRKICRTYIRHGVRDRRCHYH
jgi:hypothetical protein